MLQKWGYDWSSVEGLPAREWVCGNCDHKVSERRGFRTGSGVDSPSPLIYPCPNCRYPTLFYIGQHPGVRPGNNVDHVPAEVQRVYDQARDCCRVGAWDGAALLARSLLMHIAVSTGAAPGQPFVSYVDYLEKNHFTPPDSKDWVDHIRKQGNRAAHDLTVILDTDARDLIDLLELILRYMFEAKGKMAARRSAQATL